MAEDESRRYKTTGDRIVEPVEHVIDKSDLRGTHNGMSASRIRSAA
jgi:hypothetical protein